VSIRLVIAIEVSVALEPDTGIPWQ
jgi:hypothetical protein